VEKNIFFAYFRNYFAIFAVFLKWKTIVEKSNTEGNNGKNNIKMTTKQIKRKVGEAWAFLENPVYDRGILTSANLLYHSADKDKVLDLINKYEKGNFAIKFFGTLDPKQVYIL